MAPKIKIRVVDKKSNFKLWLPAIPFWLIVSLSSLALKFKDVIVKNIDGSDEGIKLVLELLDSEIIKDLINELKGNGKFDLIDLFTGDGTMVKISVI
ncbi:hypothetical protein RBU61_17490 [Tissierella sp. MB52-C2]|uniref:hypothetical protein n=1 Tax=Tissierella sp. MB52-C2 TaxID=3070999 RepID=UPI00280C3DD3|nr:hypothetical protein [Tissierella sp. MB52-C2]WMM24698.1 hypothetical protein RBU61_17490 [Tissierella sp. MB52-C2]